MYLVVDMEATCFEQINVRDNNEIIEIGIVICERTGDVRNSFQSFVRPVITPKLSGFCKRLTKIKQEWIDSAETLGSVLLSVEKWMKANGVSNPQSANGFRLVMETISIFRGIAPGTVYGLHSENTKT